MLAIQRKGGDEACVWVDEALVHPSLVRAYFEGIGAERVAQLNARKRLRVSARQGWKIQVESAMREADHCGST